MRGLGVKTMVLACAQLALGGTMASALAQSYPAKPIRFVNGFPAGGPADFVTRTIGQKLFELAAQPVVVENRAGAGGMIAAENVARSPADGYSLYLASSGVLAFHHHLFAKTPIDAFKDLAPVTQAVGVPEILVVHPSLPVKTVKELVALAQARPGKINYASAGAGGMPHLVAESLQIAAGTKMIHIPYKGAAPAVTELVGGQVDLTFLDIPVLLPHIRAGKLRPLAIATSNRSSLLPDLMTMTEAGYPQVRADNWYGIVVAAATPKPLIARMNELLVKAIQAPETRDKLASLGVNGVGNSPEQFLAFWRAESDHWGKLIRTVGIKLE
ncbi:MAG: tripartite tricarboxylate transporter substrate binding protein [Burkholderiales bacterium]|nr:tripartite tricarboxylate transporter substrate binding protein [Burkholderiales bacterium]